MKIAIIQRIFPHYRAELFNSLNKKYNLKVFHGLTKKYNILLNEEKYSVKSKLYSLKNIVFFKYFWKVKKFKPQVIIQEFSLKFLNIYSSYIYCKIYGCKLILWGHGYNSDFRFSDQPFFSRILRFFFYKAADASILYTGNIAKKVRKKYNLKNVFVANNTIDNKEKNLIYKKLKSIGRKKIRSKLNFKDTINLCFVSRVVERKKTEKLIEIVSYFKKQNLSVCIHFIGDGPNLFSLKQKIKKSNQTNQFKFYGPLHNEKIISKIIFASDFMVVPRGPGLSINHAFCYGTPFATLTPDKDFGPPEIVFVIDSVNSILAKSSEGLSLRILKIIKNKPLYKNLRFSTRQFYEEKLSLNKMLLGFNDAINYSLLKK